LALRGHVLIAAKLFAVHSKNLAIEQRLSLAQNAASHAGF
jgi:hypothetical protein